MEIDELAASFKPHAEEAARRRETGGKEANEEGSFLNLVLCYSENIFLQEARAFLDSVEIKTAVLMLDGSTGASQAVTVSSVVASLALSAFSGDTHSRAATGTPRTHSVPRRASGSATRRGWLLRRFSGIASRARPWAEQPALRTHPPRAARAGCSWDS